MDLMNLTASINLDSSGFENGLNQASANFDSFAEKVGGLLGGGGAIAGVALNLGNIISMVKDFAGSVLTTGMNFDKEMSAVQAVLGATEGTEENMLRLRQFGLSVAQDSIFTAEETAQAYYYMGMAGWKTEQMLAGLPGIINLAAASGEDLGQVSDIVTDSLTAFGLGAGQAAHYADVLAQTATNSNTDVSRMGQTFKYLAPVAGALGYSIEDVATSIGVVANAGIKGSQAGTTLRNIFTRLSTDGGASSKKLGALGVMTEKLGVQFYDAAGNARPWGEFIADARDAWKNLDPKNAETILKSFGRISAEGADADQVINDFTTDLDTWQTGWNSLTTTAQREQFASNLESQFAALGISMRDSNGNLKEFNRVASEARTKLGGLSTKDQIAFANTISNLRGMSTWLALMNATDEEFQNVEKSINNATGAAQTMAEVRLDNLWGDIVMFNSALDIMKVRIFDQVKGPLREIVQFGTGAIKQISDAIEQDGLEGGIAKLGEMIEAFGVKFAPMFASLGTALVPLFNSIVTNLLPAAISLGQNLGQGLVTGIIQGVQNNPVLAALFSDLMGSLNDSPIGKIIAGALGIDPNLFRSPEQQEIQNNMDYGLNNPDNMAAFLWPDLQGNVANAVESGVAQGAQDGGKTAWQQAVETGRQYMKDNASMTWAEMLQAFGGTGETETTGKKGKKKSAEQEAAESVATAATGAKVSGTSVTFDDVTVSPGAVSAAINEAIQAAGQSGSSSIQLNGQDITISDAYTIREKLVEGADGAGAQIASDISGDVNAVDTSGLSAKLGSAGQPAGSRIASAIQGTLSGRTYTINVQANVTGLPSGGGTPPTKNARAMNVGRIFNRPTMFGYANGKAQIAGDAGPEAVIGTNSLSRMIRDAVGSAMRTNAQPQPSKPDNYQIVLDSGVLVGELTPGIDNELAFIQSWRGGGRT